MIQVASPSIGDSEVQAVLEVLKSGHLVQGKFVADLESAVAEICCADHAVAVSSGTAALHLALLALGIGPGDEVLVPDFTFPATANAVQLVGATPVIIDIELKTLNLATGQLEKALTADTRAIIPVHLFGLPCDMESVRDLAKAHRVHIIEDAACAMGSSCHGSPAGSLGDIGCFSFHPRKVVTTGEGGILTTSNQELADKLRSLRSHGFESTPAGHMQISRAGLNYRMSDIHAALGVEQVKRIDEFITKRRQVARWYFDRLQGAPNIRLPQDHAAHTYQSFVILLDETVPRDSVIAQLKDRSIQTTIGTYALSEQPIYQANPGAGSCKNGAMAQNQSVSLPMHTQLAEADIDQVCQALLEIVTSTGRT